MKLTELVPYLDEYLAIRDVPDYRDAYNGLQVEGPADVSRVAVAVDACAATIDAAVAGGAQFLLVHHGLFWGVKVPITGTVYRRLAPLIRSGVAVYACHLPLDAHPEVGNNHVLARILGLDPGGLFGEFEGVPIGVWCDADLDRAELAGRIRDALRVEPHVIATGPEQLRRVGIVTGGGGDWADRAQAAGCDTLVTGEGQHHTYFSFEERGMNAIYAGHYATETVGVKALAAHLGRKFGLETFFIDHPTGL